MARPPPPRRPGACPSPPEAGFTLVEALLSLAIGALVLTAIYGVMAQALGASDSVRERNERTRSARFAMQRMVNAVSRTPRLLLPLAENPATGWSEAVREPGVLAVTLDPEVDRDSDGIADADNDKDGAVDEDVGRDVTNDGAAGLLGIDDDNDGLVDESNAEDDDEDEDFSGQRDEESLDGLDDDNDGAVDEDLSADLNRDGSPGRRLVDDDGDGQVDESIVEDDDEDLDDRGTVDEDWLDAVVYHLAGAQLLERLPDPNPADGRAFTERVLAEGVSRFRVERIPRVADGSVLVAITLELTSPGGGTVSLDARVRVGRHL